MIELETEHPARPTAGRRSVLRAAAGGVIAAAAATVMPFNARAVAANTVGESAVAAGIRAFKLYTGPDHASHLLEGTLDDKARIDLMDIHFTETPAYSSEDWHHSPVSQYVITLSGTLEFTTREGQTFVIRPGDVLPSENDVGTGHKWRLIDDQPWRRAYVVLQPGAKNGFVAKPSHRRDGSCMD